MYACICLERELRSRSVEFTSVAYLHHYAQFDEMRKNKIPPQRLRKRKGRGHEPRETKKKEPEGRQREPSAGAAGWHKKAKKLSPDDRPSKDYTARGRACSAFIYLTARAWIRISLFLLWHLSLSCVCSFPRPRGRRVCRRRVMMRVPRRGFDVYC